MDKLNIESEKLYYIGGIVRDEILGINCFDIDLTYQGDAIEFCKTLEEKGIGKIIQINEPFGTVRMVIDGKEYDIASTRDEIYEVKGHLPTVSNIGCDLQTDVKRRDFTINSLAKSVKTGEIVDYLNGLEDIKNKKLRILHDGSFVDDPTRIVRGLKFSVRFNFELDEHTKLLQDKYLENVNYDMSQKRLKKELMETFNLNSQEAYEKFFSQKIYKLITPSEIVPPVYNIEQLVKKYPVSNIWLVYLGWMKLDNLPLTKEEKTILDDYNILSKSDIFDDDFSIYKSFYGKSKEAVLLYIITSSNDYGQRFLGMEKVSIKITGEDLKNMGISPSRKYSECFDYVLKEKLSNPKMSKNDEIICAKKFFGINSSEKH